MKPLAVALHLTGFKLPALRDFVKNQQIFLKPPTIEQYPFERLYLSNGGNKISYL